SPRLVILSRLPRLFSLHLHLHPRVYSAHLVTIQCVQMRYIVETVARNFVDSGKLCYNNVYFPGRGFLYLSLRSEVGLICMKGARLTRNFQEENNYILDSISHSVEQTQRLGMRLGELLRGGELLLLEGQLGTGKTTFTQGLALGLNITARINSPTFTLLKEYPGQPRPTLSDTPTLTGPALYHKQLSAPQ